MSPSTADGARTEPASRRIDGERALRLVKFLAAGFPSFLFAVPTNYVLVAHARLGKPAAYAIVLAGQVTINFFVLRAFVFDRTGKPWPRQFAEFFGGILGLRTADWLTYVVLADVFGFFYLGVQLLNVALFSLAKFLFAERVFRAY